MNNQTGVYKKWGFKILVFVLLASLILPGQFVAAKSESLEVAVKSKTKATDNYILVKINTNLPKKTKFTITITGKHDFEKTKNVKADKNGNFEKKFKKLKDGIYDVNITSVKTSKQKRKVRKIFGDDASNLTGEFIKDKKVRFSEYVVVGEEYQKQEKEAKELIKVVKDSPTQENFGSAFSAVINLPFAFQKEKYQQQLIEIEKSLPADKQTDYSKLKTNDEFSEALKKYSSNVIDTQLLQKTLRINMDADSYWNENQIFKYFPDDTFAIINHLKSNKNIDGIIFVGQAHMTDDNGSENLRNVIMSYFTSSTIENLGDSFSELIMSDPQKYYSKADGYQIHPSVYSKLDSDERGTLPFIKLSDNNTFDDLTWEIK
ncbi:hypothetical protein HCJ66_01235 [Listeria sp. FSL L7-1582]|uniref:hypothetical protein n=1 Tax=Listeria portnoyi TaxID=2713504 RepID=UPI00164E9999|nr:hypothetical protein [Listeria portnoyi]MBC6308166.1 hypothetical protein [Listeria portnoyi]